MDDIVIDCKSSYSYAMSLKEGVHFEKLRFFLSGFLGLENTSELVQDSPINIFSRAFEEGDTHAVEFFLTDPLDPTDPWNEG